MNDATLLSGILQDFPYRHEVRSLTGNRTFHRITGPGLFIQPEEAHVQDELFKLRSAYVAGRLHPATPAILNRMFQVLLFAEAMIDPKHRTRISEAIKELEQLIDHR